MAEIEHGGGIARITGTADTESDDVIQYLVDLLEQEGISGDKVASLYSERQPSPEWYAYFEKHWPNAAITWSFAAGEDAKMEAAAGELLARRSKPWWGLW